MIKHLSLVNFRKHEALEVPFTSGVNIICGGNYQGKTTILHAIMFALFGVSAVPGGASSAWKRGSDKTKVVLLMILEGVEIEVARTRTGATLTEGGEPSATGTTAVNSRVEALLGLSKADFSRIKYAKQGETSALLTYGAGALNEMIERVSGVELVSSILEKTKDVKLRQEGVVGSMQEQEIPPLVERVTELDRELVTLLHRLDEAEELITSATAREKQGKDVLRREEERHTASRILEKERARLQTLVTATSESLAENEEMLSRLGNPTKAKVDEAEKAEEALRVELTRLTRESQRLSELKETVIKLTKRVDSATRGLEQLQVDERRTVEKLAEEVDQEARLTDLGEQLRVNSNRFELISASLDGADCPTCKKPLDESFDKEAAKEKATGLVTLLTALEKEYKEVETSQRNFTEASKAYSKAADRLTNFNSTRLEEDSKDLKDNQLEEAKLGEPTDLAPLKALLHESSENRKALNKALQTSARFHGTLEQLDISLEAAKSAFNKLEKPMELLTLTPLETAVEVAEEALGKLILEKDGLALRRGELAYAITSAKAAVTGAEESNKALVKAEARLGKAVALQKFLKSNREEFMANAWDSLLGYASGMVSDVTGGAVSQIRRQKDSFTYVEEGEEMAIASASGSQNSIMGLCLKLAISSRLQDGFQCLLLDEVSADMDEPHSHAVTAFLRSTGQQVIAVSHRDSDLSGDCNVISL